MKLDAVSWVWCLRKGHHNDNSCICEISAWVLRSSDCYFTKWETEMLESLLGINSRHHPDLFCSLNAPSLVTRMVQDFLTL